MFGQQFFRHVPPHANKIVCVIFIYNILNGYRSMCPLAVFDKERNKKQVYAFFLLLITARGHIDLLPSQQLSLHSQYFCAFFLRISSFLQVSEHRPCYPVGGDKGFKYYQNCLEYLNRCCVYSDSVYTDFPIGQTTKSCQKLQL